MNNLKDVLCDSLSGTPTLILPIGPSGAGKSFLFEELKKLFPDIQAFSWDTLRHEWYDADNYKIAFEKSIQDRGFEAKANARFKSMIETKQHIYVDNTNLTPRRRKFFLEQSHKYGYTTIAFVLNTPLETLIERQTTRTDKTVPEDAVRRQYSSMVLPTSGEFHKVVMTNDQTKSDTR